MKGEIQKEGEILAIEVHKEQISDKIPTDAGKIWTNYHSVQTRRCCQQNWPIRWGGINSTSTYLNFCHNLSPPSLLFLFANILSCLWYCFLRFTARISEIEARWRYHKFDLTYYKRLEELCYGTDLLEIWKTFFYRERKTELFTQIVVFYYKKLDRF